MNNQKTLIGLKKYKVSVDIMDLEELGWNFDNMHENVYQAHHDKHKGNYKGYDHTYVEDHTYDMNSASEYNYQNYHVEIKVIKGKTYLRIVNTKLKANRIDDGSDSESTGDDAQTVKALEELNSKGLLWDIEKI